MLGTRILIVLCAAALPQQIYQGADRAIREILNPSPEVKAAPDPNAPLRSAIEAYRASWRRMPAGTAAERWLELLDRCPRSLEMIENPTFREPTFTSDIIAALPAPALWPKIEGLLTTRVAKDPKSDRLRAELAFAEALQGRFDAARMELTYVEDSSAEAKAILSMLDVDLALLGGDKAKIEGAFRHEAEALSGPTQPIGGDKSIELPDLTVLLGVDRARPLLRDLLRTFDGELVAHRGPAFRKLARDTALESISAMKHPQWTLADDVDGAALFVAMHKRFPESAGGMQLNPEWASSTFGGAATRYIMYLVANGRAEEAAAMFRDMANTYWFGMRYGFDDEIALLKKAGKIEAYLGFLEHQISGGNSMVTNHYRAICDDLGLQDRSTKFFAKLPRNRQSPYNDPTYTEVTALLAQGKALDACELLSRRLKNPGSEAQIAMSSQNAASELVEIGRYLHRADFVEQGLAAGERAQTSGGFIFTTGWVLLDLADHGRGPEAERLATKMLQKSVHQTNRYPPGGQEELGYLARIYSRSHRYADVVTLLDEAPDWGVDDLSLIRNVSQDESNSLSFIAAQALGAVGRTGEALRVLAYELRTETTPFDPAYALLLRLDPKNSGVLLDAMHRAKPSTTRPLIWKARFLQLNGRLAEADRMIRQAISMDPQDSECWMSKTRFQAWTILAGIERAEGKTAQADRHQRLFDSHEKYVGSNGGVLDALYSHEAARWQRELSAYPDDYKLRFAFAQELSGEGKTGESKKQYLAAYRLSAVQAGEMGGPYYDYDDPNADPEAAFVLEGMAAARPKDGGIQAVLGYIYTQENKCPEALKAYERATALDRDDIAAWRGIDQLRSQVELPQTLIDQLALNLARLSPGELSWPASSVRNFADLWSTADAALAGPTAPGDTVFPLPASHADPRDVNVENTRRSSRQMSAGSVLGGDRTLSDFGRLLSSVGGQKRP